MRVRRFGSGSASVGKRLAVAAVMLFASAAVAQAQDTFWDSACDAGVCVASQINVNAEGDAVMRTDITSYPDGSALFSVRIPNAVLLGEGPWLTVGGVYLAEMAYVHCANGCIATATLSPDLATGFYLDADAVVTVVGLDRSRRGIPVSLRGLAAALHPEAPASE